MGNDLTNQGETNRGANGAKTAEAASPSSAEAGVVQGEAKAEGARPGEPRPIRRVAADLGVPDEHVLVYGHGKAKIDLDYLRSLPERDSKLVLVTAISPTPAGEGKTTTSIGLADGLARLGKRPVLALREPSMGPVFGIKGGAVGGGRAQVTPGDEINLHFTGDFAAIAEANNLLAAMADNALHFGTHDIDPRTVAIRRSIDMNDRSLRDVVIGLGGRLGGVTRESGFDITAASQVMATFCMADSLDDLRERLGRIVVGRSSAGDSVTAADLGAVGAMTAVLKDALAPNLVQTLEGNPALVHGGPFANIAHGTNSVIATKAALKLGDVAVTEAGFGADLGAEKFFDIIGQTAGIAPDLTVVVATVRALKYHGGVALADLEEKNVAAVRAGAVNLRRHCENLTKVFAQRVLVAVNRFAADTEAESRPRVRGRPRHRRRPHRPLRPRGRGGARFRRRRREVAGQAEHRQERIQFGGFPGRQGAGYRHQGLPRGRRRLRTRRGARAPAARGVRLGRAARVHGQNPIFVFDRPESAWRPRGLHRADPRSAPLGRGGLRGAHLGLDHDDAGPAQAPLGLRHRRGRRGYRGNALSWPALSLRRACSAEGASTNCHAVRCGCPLIACSLKSN